MKQKYLKVFAFVLAMTVILSILGGCSSSKPDATTEAAGVADGAAGSVETAAGASKVFSVACSENMTKMDPYAQNQLNGYAAMRMSFDPLVNNDHAGNYTPGLATEWSCSDDGTVWTFKLRDGVTFHNGEAFSADDVVCSFQRLLDENSKLSCYNSYFTSLQAVEKIDDYNVNVILKAPNPCFLDVIEHAVILPNEAYAEFGEGLWNDQKMYGTGGWIFEEWVSGEYIKWNKNPNYWAGNNSVYDTVYMRFVTEASSAIAAQLSGEVDAYMPSSGIPDEMLSLYNGYEDKIEIVSFNSTFIKYFGLQCEEGSPFHEQDIREAFSLAIDRETLNQVFFPGCVVPSGILSKNCKGYDPDLPTYEYDPDKAAQLLAASSYKGEEITLMSNTNVFRAEEVLLSVSEMLNKAGFNTTISVEEWAVFSDKRSQGDYDCFMVDAVQMYGDSNSFLNLRIRTNGHHSNYENDELMALIDQSNVEMNPETRATQLREINKMIHYSYGPTVPISNLIVTFAIDKDVTGLVYYPDACMDIRYVGN